MRVQAKPRAWTLVALAAALAAPASALAHSEDAPPHELVADVLAEGRGTEPSAATEPDADPHAAAESPSLALPPPGVPLYTSRPLAARLGSSDASRYALAGGCFSLRPSGSGAAVARSGRRYEAKSSATDDEVFRLQATDLGTYLLLGSEGSFPTVAGGSLRAADHPTRGAVWTVDGDPARGYQLIAQEGGRLAVDAAGAGLTLAQASGPQTRFEFEAAPSCAAFREIEVNSSGRPNTSRPRFVQTTGLIDIHSHILAFEAWGGGFHCGRPWHPLGVATALADCPVKHNPATPTGLAHNLLTFQDPANMHHPGGWSNFEGWPTYQTEFLHERSYYRWIERAWRGGLRILTMLAVDNSAVCLVNVTRTHNCNEMDAVRRQLKDAHDLEDYIDAQAGGPGKGFFRIVRNPFQARRVINRGKLAVILGIETSEPFDCWIRNGHPQCDRKQIDEGLDEVYRVGVRQMELMNKFDNALAGVAMDAGPAGAVVNTANKIVTGDFWQVETCTGPDHDKEQATTVPPDAAALIALMPGGAQPLPVYPPPPHCNKKGLTDLGRYAIRGMIERGMIFDPDHLSVLARSQALDLIEARDYPGVVSSHGWADDTSYQRITSLGGIVVPNVPGTPQAYVDEWKERREDLENAKRARRFGFGFGFSSDVNGFGGGQGPAGGTDAEITYPFHSLDGAVELDRQKSGNRTFDFNTDGVAHYGLHPDYVEGVRLVGSRATKRDTLGGAEAYLRMWERAVGIPAPRAARRHGHVRANGIRRVRLQMTPPRLLRRRGQPWDRTRVWTWRVRTSRRGRLVAVFTRNRRVGLAATNARGYEADGVHPGASAGHLPAGARRIARGIYVAPAGDRRSRFVYGVRRGKVRFVGVGTGPATANTTKLATLARLARLARR